MVIKSRLSQIFSKCVTFLRNYPQIKLNTHKKMGNMRTYAQFVDNLWVRCGLSICSGQFFTMDCV